MQTPYCGHATIGGFHADVEIANVDVSRWKGTATNVHGRGQMPREAVVTLLEQPRPGWSARAEATRGEDGVLHLEGTSFFHGPAARAVASARRSLWVKKLPRGA